jgi:hypothetical protein
MQTWQAGSGNARGAVIMWVETEAFMLIDYAHKVSTSHHIVAPGKRIDHKRNRAATFRTVMMPVFLFIN